MEVKVQSILVAVLPFQNSSQEPDLDYFLAGFAEDLIVDLSKFSALQVISSRSIPDSFEHPDPFITNQNTSQADYLVKGSCRRQVGNIRLNIQLVSRHDNRVVWAERFNENKSQFFETQDHIIEHIANTLQIQIDEDLLEESRKKDRANLEAYDCWLRGMEHLKKGTLTDDEVARTYFEQALEKAPNYSRAYTGLSLSYFNEWSCQIWERWDVSKKGAFEFAHKAIAINDNDYVAHVVLGQVYLFNAAYEKAEHHLRKSLNLNANDANILCQVAFNFTFLGYTKEAEKLYQKAVRLNPLKSQSYFPVGGLIYFELGQFEKSLELWSQVNLEVSWVDLPANVAGAYFMLGQKTEMWHYWQIYKKLFEKRILLGEPGRTNEAAQWIININPYRGKSNMLPFLEFISNNGLEEEGSLTGTVDDPSAKLNIFRQGAGLWEIRFEQKTVLLPHLKGFIDIAKLLRQPHQQLHCMELMGMPVKVEDAPVVIDEKAKQAYKKRLQELATDLEEAELYNDTENALKLRKEYDELVAHLSKALGLNGKPRKLSSDVERARSAVTWRLRSAIKKIEEVHPNLGLHLSKSVETGTFCTYDPEKNIDWST